MSESLEFPPYYPPIQKDLSPSIAFETHRRRAIAHANDVNALERAFRLLGDLSNRHEALRKSISTTRMVIDIEMEKHLNQVVEHWQLAKGYKEKMKK